jgi:hypothetical protein
MDEEEIEKFGSEPEDASDPNVVLPEENLKKSPKEEDGDDDDG